MNMPNPILGLHRECGEGKEWILIVDLYNISFLTKKQTVLLNCDFESIAVLISVPFGFLDKLIIVVMCA